MQSCPSPIDTLGRYGGEEFLFLLPDTAAWSARMVAERVRQVIAAEPVHHHGRDIQISTSIGVATVEANFEGQVGALLQAADDALYEAKRTGRNRVVSVTLDATGEPARPSPTADLVVVS